MNYLKDIIDYGVIGLLVFMSFLSVWFFIERLLFFWKLDVKKFATKEELELKATSFLSLIATIAASAPYVGLLGTVLGIILTFYTMGQHGIVNTKEIMIGLALALKATAMGLVVAIPATWMYNYLVRKVEVALAKWDIEHAA